MGDVGSNGEGKVPMAGTLSVFVIKELIKLAAPAYCGPAGTVGRSSLRGLVKSIGILQPDSIGDGDFCATVIRSVT